MRGAVLVSLDEGRSGEDQEPSTLADHLPDPNAADVEARLAESPGRGETANSLELLVPEVRAFWNLVTSEATGWQATLRDKNVPLP